MADQTEELILAIERAYFPLPALTIRLTAVEQSLSALWASFGQVETPANTTFSGTVDGCSSGIAGITVDVYNHATSALLGTVTSGSGGAFSGTLSLSGATLSVDFVGSGTNWTTTTLNATVAAGTSNAVGAIGLTAASGYVCVPGCNTPVNQTLTVTDTKFSSSFAATYQGVFSGLYTWQTTGATVNYTGDGSVPCASVANLPIQYTLTNSAAWASKATYVAVGLFNACPALSGSGAASNHVLSSVACPPGFSAVFTNAAAQRLYSHDAAGADTITWFG